MVPRKIVDTCRSCAAATILLSGQFGFVVLLLELYGEPTRRGFFCDDDSIKYPYKKNTVSEVAIVASAFIIPVAVVILTELFYHGLRFRSRVKCWKFSFPAWTLPIIQFSGVYLMGIGFSQVASDLGKFTIGRLRPHFLAVCSPNITCTAANMHVFIDDYLCTGNVNDVMEARLSFPSGHATLSFYGSVYVIAYMQSSAYWCKFGFARHIIQFLFFVAAWWVSLTRVMDNWHHPSDVLAGGCLGTAVALAVIKYVSNLRPVTDRDQKNGELLPLRKTNSSSYIPPSPS